MKDRFASGFSFRPRLPLVLMMLLVLIPRTAFAEVMDKEPPLTSVWMWGVAGGLLGLAACRIRPFLGVITLPVPIHFFIWRFNEIFDPFVGPAIAREAPRYTAGVFWGALLLVGGHVARLIWWNDHRKRKAGRRSVQPEQ